MQVPAAAAVAAFDPWVSEPQRALYELWREKRGFGRLMPAWSQLDPIELRRWLGDLNLLQVIDGGKDFRYRVHGTNISRVHDIEMTGKLVSDWPPLVRGRALATYRRAVADAKPYLVTEAELLQRHPRANSRLVLPFGQGATVDKILVHLVIGGRLPTETDAEYLALD